MSLYLFPCWHTSSKRHFGNHRVVAEQGAGLSSALHHAEEPIRDPSLFVNLGKDDGGDGSHGRGLEHHGVT